MPSTSPPDFNDVVPKVVWDNGSSTNSFGQRTVVAGVDEIKASDINNIRAAIELLWSHQHSYTDSVGRC